MKDSSKESTQKMINSFKQLLKNYSFDWCWPVTDSGCHEDSKDRKDFLERWFNIFVNQDGMDNDRYSLDAVIKILRDKDDLNLKEQFSSELQEIKNIDMQVITFLEKISKEDERFNDLLQSWRKYEVLIDEILGDNK